jgi:hypothetical protein
VDSVQNVGMMILLTVATVNTCHAKSQTLTRDFFHVSLTVPFHHAHHYPRSRSFYWAGLSPCAACRRRTDRTVRQATVLKPPAVAGTDWVGAGFGWKPPFSFSAFFVAEFSRDSTAAVSPSDASFVDCCATADAEPIEEMLMVVPPF